MAQKRAPETTLKVLHLEDSEVDHELVRRVLARTDENFELQRVESLEDFAEQLQTQHFDVILADYRLPGFTALDAWQTLQQQQESPPFVLLSGAIGESAAVAAIKMGVSDYLAKDEVSKLASTIRRVLEVHAIRRAKVAADAELALSQKRLAE